VNKQYKKPPIIEALCEFQFGQDTPWDLTIPGLVYEKISDIFPKRSQIARVAMSPSRKETGPQIDTTPLMRFTSEDEKTLIQVGTHLLTINYLNSYSSWEDFLSLIRKGYEAYCEVAPPKSIHRIGLRYINNFQIKGKTTLEDFFNFYPYIGPDLPQTIGSFVTFVQLPFENARDILNLQLASLTGITDDSNNIRLDLDYFLAQSEKIQLSEIFSWIDTAHTQVEKTFEACITDKLRKTFEE
jgi:uncharacterized protein (TIGR04255 family)